MLNIRHLYGRLVPHTLTWSFCVKAEVKLAGLLLRSVPLVFGQLTSSLVKVTWGYARNVRRMYVSMGSRGLAIYLKACYVLLQHAAGGMKDQSPWALGANVSRTRRGIPRIINPQHRRLILSGDIGVIRFWLTLFGLYRVIEYKGTLKLGTITKPGKDLSGFRNGWNAWIPDFYSRARLITGSEWKLDPSKDLTPWSIPFIRKASPNSQGFASVMGLPWDLLAFASDPLMKSTLLRWLALVDGLDLIWGLKPIWKFFEARAIAYAEKQLEIVVPEKPWDPREGYAGSPLHLQNRKLAQEWADSRDNSKAVRLWMNSVTWGGKPIMFGRLGFKEEPGKIRVFAMVNIVTQAVMQPLHKWVFRHLRMLPTDGTFDQTRPVESLIKTFREEGEWVASYDLSAATDRLPLLLQTDLLRPLLGNELPSLWATLLVGRPYGLPKIAKSYNLGYDCVSYTVGQPMGALSSWALLALTHHALVQYAASLAYPKESGWFLRYAVLGDDVVIADRTVAREYLRIMEEIGVEIGLAKSLVSNQSSLEFAKRTWIRGRDASPVSLAEMLVALTHLGALEQLIRKNMPFGVIRLASVARFAGFGYRNLARLPVVLGVGNRLTGLIGYLCRPGGAFPMPIEAWLSSVAPGGKDGEVLDTRQWVVAQSMWTYFIGACLRRLLKVDKTLYSASTFRFTDATFEKRKGKGGAAAGRVRRGEELERVPFFKGTADEFFGITEKSVMWNEFFLEWIVRPFSITFRRGFEKVDDTLRVLDPKILPSWARLEELWKEVLDTEAGLSALPSRVEFALRETVELSPSTRLIGVWRKLRTLALREALPATSLRAGFSAAPEARRRRRGG
jgi:hypothetical protein